MTAEPAAAMQAVDPTRPLAPGTFTFRQRGFSVVDGRHSDVPALGTMIAEPADGDRQVWGRFVDVDGPVSDVTQRWSPEGVWMVSGVQRQALGDQVVEVPCQFVPPLLVVPWPIAAGMTHRGIGECGAFQATMTTTVVRREDGILCGREVDLWVIESTLESPAPFKGTGRQRDWVSWDLASMFVRQQIEVDFDIFGVQIHNEIDAELVTDGITF